MATLEKKRTPSVTIIDPIVPSRSRSNPSSPSIRSNPLPPPPPSPIASALQRSKDGSVILPSPPTHEPEDLLVSRRLEATSQEGISRERAPSPFQSLINTSATTSTSSLSLPASPTSFIDSPLPTGVISERKNENQGADEEEELEELADEDDLAREATLPPFDPVALQKRDVKGNQFQADLSLTLLAVQLAALKALHSLLFNFLSSITTEAGSTPEVNAVSTSPSISTSAQPAFTTKELLTSLLDTVEEISSSLVPERVQPPQASGTTPAASSAHPELSRESSGLGIRTEASLSKLISLLDALPTLNSSTSSTSQLLASPSDIQLSSTLGALVKSLNQVRKENNQSSHHHRTTTGEAEESEGEDSGSGSFSVLGSEGLDPTSPMSPPSLDSPSGSSSQEHRQAQHLQISDPNQPSASSSSLPLATPAFDSQPHQRRGSFPTTTAPQFNLIEEQLRDPFAETTEHHQQEPDVFSTLHKLMANLSGRNLPHGTLGSENGKVGEDRISLGSECSNEVVSTDSELFPRFPSLSEPFADSRINSNLDNASASLGPISQASHLLAITRELVAARRAIYSPSPSRFGYGYGAVGSSLRSRSAGASSASVASQTPSLRDIAGITPGPQVQHQSQEMDQQSLKGDLNSLGRLSRTSSLSARSDRGAVGSVETSTTTLANRAGATTAQYVNPSSPANATRSPAPPRYEEEDGVESRSVDTHGGSLRSSLIGSQSTTLPAYAGLGIASSDKEGAAYKEKEKDRDRNSVSSSLRSPNGSSAALQTPPGILRNPLAQQSTSQSKEEGERARSPSGRSEYAARTSADLSLVQSSIERLYSAVPQLADQRVSAPPKLAAAIQNSQLGNTQASSSSQSQQQVMDINIEELVMRMGKRGRMEDQRAALSLKIKNPNSNSSNNASPTILSDKEEEDSNQNKGSGSNNQSRFSVGSLSGLGSLRRIGGKGKGKEETSSNQRSDPFNGHDEIVRIQPQVSPLIDQTVDESQKWVGRKSKLEKMGMNSSSGPMEGPDMDDDPLFDLLASSTQKSRMPNQDAVFRPSGSRLKVKETDSPSRGDD